MIIPLKFNHVATEMHRANRRRGQLGAERRNLANRRQDKPLRDEIKAALTLANAVLFEMSCDRACEHDIPERVCPLCAEQPYNRRWDIEAEAVQ